LAYDSDPQLEKHMNSPRDDLFQPSLSEDHRPAAAPYSVQTTFLTGFLGGPFAAIAILITNSIRLRRAERDAPAWVALSVLTFAAMWVMFKTAMGAEARAWLEAQLGNRSLRLAAQVLALAIVGAGYAMHRQEQRNTELLGIKRPNGWLGGLACLSIGAVVTIVYLVLLQGL
jgi:hypothetical protein